MMECGQRAMTRSQPPSKTKRLTARQQKVLEACAFGVTVSDRNLNTEEQHPCATFRLCTGFSHFDEQQEIGITRSPQKLAAAGCSCDGAGAHSNRICESDRIFSMAIVFLCRRPFNFFRCCV